jgi:hypothetical protein
MARYPGPMGGSSMRFTKLVLLLLAVPLGGATRAEDVVNVKDFGAKGNGVTEDSVFIQAAIDAAAALAHGGVVLFPPGTYLHGYGSLLMPRSNVTLRGVGRQSILKMVQPNWAPAGIYKAGGGGSITNFHIENLAFDGDRTGTPANQNTNAIQIELDAGESLSDFSVEGCYFQDSQNHHIFIHANHSTASGTRIRITNNTFLTTAEKRNLVGATWPESMDAVRIEYENAGNTPGTYGVYPFSGIEVTRNYAEYCRTLADLKRGCRDFVIAGNRTYNMYDDDHSVDGVMSGTIHGNIIKRDAVFSPRTGHFSIEIQGVCVSVHGNHIDANNSIVSGIVVTQYGRPEETVGPRHQVGYPSISVSIGSGNTVKGVSGHAYRIIDGRGCSIAQNSAESVGGEIATVEAPGTSYDGTDTVLSPLGCVVDGNKGKSIASGVKLSQGTN